MTKCLKKSDKKSFELYQVNSIQIGGIMTFCLLGHILIWGYYDILPPGAHFDLEVLGHFLLKNQTRKIDKIHNNFRTISSIHA